MSLNRTGGSELTSDRRSGERFFQAVIESHDYSRKHTGRMYYFDPSFGYIYVNGDGLVRYGLGPVVPHDPSTVTNQRYTQFGGWVEIAPHYVPDEWLEAFRNPHEAYQEKITIKPILWGWREWSLLIPIWGFIVFVAYTFLTSLLAND